MRESLDGYGWGGGVRSGADAVNSSSDGIRERRKGHDDGIALE